MHDIRVPETLLFSMARNTATWLGSKLTYIEARRKKLYPIMKEAKNQNKKTALVRDKLYIDGVLFVPNINQENLSQNSDARANCNSKSNTDTIDQTIHAITRRSLSKTLAIHRCSKHQKMDSEDPELFITKLYGTMQTLSYINTFIHTCHISTFDIKFTFGEVSLSVRVHLR